MQRPRARSVLSSLERRGLGVRLALFLVPAGVGAVLVDERGAGLTCAGLATAALAVLAAADLRALRRLSDWLASAGVPSDRACAGTMIDLGIGDELRPLGPEIVHPYRGPAPAGFDVRPVVLRGDPAQTTRLLHRAATLRAAAAIAAACVFGAASFVHPQRAAPVEVLTSLDVRPPQLMPWYPRQPPVLTDVDRDGVEDVIGIRQVHGKSGGFVVAATSGATFRALWTTASNPSPDVTLVVSGGTLFELQTDGRVTLRNPTTGQETRRLQTAGAHDACPVEDGVWVQTWWRAATVELQRDGTLIRGDGSTEPRARPASCPRSTFCAPDTYVPCTPQPGLGDLERARFGTAPILRRHGPDGLALVLSGSDPDRDGDYLYGFDPGTFAVRWRQPLYIEREHPSPQGHHEVSHGRIFSYLGGMKGPAHVRATEALGGRVLWQDALPGAEPGDDFHGFTASGTRLYVATSSRLEILDAQTGQPLGTLR